MLLDNLEKWDELGGREVQEGVGIRIFSWLVHIVKLQKPRRHCKAFILQSKISL